MLGEFSFLFAYITSSPLPSIQRLALPTQRATLRVTPANSRRQPAIPAGEEQGLSPRPTKNSLKSASVNSLPWPLACPS